MSLAMINVAVIGAGRWGPNLLRNFHDLNQSQVRWVCDTQQDRLDQVAERYPGVKLTKSAQDAIEDPEVDALVVATPTVTHYELVEQALKAGKHVLVEKPLTANSPEGAKLAALAKEKGRVLMVGHVFMFNDAVRAVKQYIQDGDLGRVYYVSMTRTNLGPIRMDVNAAWDLASHDISIVNYWLDADPIAVSAMGGAWINQNLQDAIFATVRYPKDVLVHMHASWLHPRKAREIAVIGDKKMLTFDDMNPVEPVRIYDKSVGEEVTKPAFVDTIAGFRASVRNGEVSIPKVTTGEPLKNECVAFLDAIGKSGEPYLSDGDFGVSVVKTLEALDRSIAAGGQEQKVQ